MVSNLHDDNRWLSRLQYIRPAPATYCVLRLSITMGCLCNVHVYNNLYRATSIVPSFGIFSTPLSSNKGLWLICLYNRMLT